MSMFFSSTLWILGDVPDEIRQSLLDDGWEIVESSEMGVCLTLDGNYRRAEIPRFEKHTDLLCILSMTHEASPNNHHLSVAYFDNFVEGYFEDEDVNVAGISSTGHSASASGQNLKCETDKTL